MPDRPGARQSAAALVLALVLPLVVACSASQAAPTDTIRVVASTDVYGALAHAIAGRQASVTSLIRNPSQDPHSYEASARDQLAVGRADVVIENGAGYDDFVDRMLRAADSGATVVTAVRLSPTPAAARTNEHVWYDFATVARVVDRLRAVFTAQRPEDRNLFAHNAAAVLAGLHSLDRAAGAIRAAYGGTGVAITEPLPLYLLAACGLVNRTPEEFSSAVEAGTDVSVRSLRQTLGLMDSGAAHALVYNEQTIGIETTRLIAAAHAHGVPVVPMTETLPSGQDYLTWMRANLARLRSALAAAA
jgi:zinc/manganese transport system substrate-binding protein